MQIIYSIVNNRIFEQVRIQNKIVADLARRIQQVRVNAKAKKSEIENKYIKISNYKKRVDDLTLTLEEIEGQKLNVEERTKRLEKMVEVCTVSRVRLLNTRFTDLHFLRPFLRTYLSNLFNLEAI